MQSHRPGTHAGNCSRSCNLVCANFHFFIVEDDIIMFQKENPLETPSLAALRRRSASPSYTVCPTHCFIGAVSSEHVCPKHCFIGAASSKREADMCAPSIASLVQLVANKRRTCVPAPLLLDVWLEVLLPWGRVPEGPAPTDLC